jgi:parallel beta-helix repeat protein
VAVAVFAGALHVGAAHAAYPPCGTITSSTTLTADCAAPLTIGASGITVNLGFHTVFCESAVSGIVIPSRVSLSNVQNGFVSRDEAQCGTGVEVDGSSNQVLNIVEYEANGSGFQMAAGANFNRLIGDEAILNGDAGFISFGNHNTVRLGESAGNPDNGISFFVGSGNRASSNFVILNGKGIISGAGHTIVASNQVFDNSIGIYLSDNSTGSTVYQNTVEGNSAGIDISAASSGNVVYSNTSRDNLSIDMYDENPFCDSNVWNLNTFVTANQSCIH